MGAEEFIASLNMQSGTIELPNKIATLKLTEKFRSISLESAERLLVEAWGNHPGNKTLGIILSTDNSPLSANGSRRVPTVN